MVNEKNTSRVPHEDGGRAHEGTAFDSVVHVLEATLSYHVLSLGSGLHFNSTHILYQAFGHSNRKSVS